MMIKRLAAIGAAIALTASGVAQAQNPAASLFVTKSARAGAKSTGEKLNTTGGVGVFAVVIIVIAAVAAAAIAGSESNGDDSDSN